MAEPMKIRATLQGDVADVRILMMHPMETGQRKDADGKVIPRMIINKVVCRYNGEEVFAADLAPAISANPYLSFFTQATSSGKLEFVWTDDAGKTYTHTAQLTVE